MASLASIRSPGPGHPPQFPGASRTKEPRQPPGPPPPPAQRQHLHPSGTASALHRSRLGWTPARGRSAMWACGVTSARPACRSLRIRSSSTSIPAPTGTGPSAAGAGLPQHGRLPARAARPHRPGARRLPAGTAGRPGGAAGPGNRDPCAGHLGPAAPARPGHAQGPRLHPRPGLPDGGLAGHDLALASSPARWCRPSLRWQLSPARRWSPTWLPPAPAGWPPGSGRPPSCARAAVRRPPRRSGQRRCCGGGPIPAGAGAGVDQSSWQV
jgi:hypothetical protein